MTSGRSCTAEGARHPGSGQRLDLPARVDPVSPPWSPVVLKGGYPYWAVKNGLMYAFPQLAADLSCDVAVVGAGITGALIADELAGHGHDVVVLDQRDVCWGST